MAFDGTGRIADHRPDIILVDIMIAYVLMGYQTFARCQEHSAFRARQ